MEKFRTRPLDNYIFEAEWQDLYLLTRHWLSDLLFYKDDLKFLHKLIDSYFIWLTKSESIDQVEELEEGLQALDRLADGLQQQIKEHLGHLSQFMENPFIHDGQKFRGEHQLLEDSFAEFVKKARDQRKAIFKVTEVLMDSDEIRSRVGK